MSKPPAFRSGTVDYALLGALAHAPRAQFMTAEYFADLVALRGWTPHQVRKALNRVARAGVVEREQRVDDRTGNRYMVYRLREGDAGREVAPETDV